MHLAKTFRAIDHTIFYRTLLQLHTSGYIKVYHLIPIDMARGQAKPNIKNNLRQPPILKDQGEVFGVRTPRV